MRIRGNLLQFCGLLVSAALLAPGTSSFALEPTHGSFRTSDGVKIHFVEAGKGTPVILIHGYTGSAEGNWFSNGIAQALAANHRVIAIDCRNHGKSDKPVPGGPGLPRDVVELVDYLHIPKAHFHGYSMGGGIVARLLTMIPDRMITASFGGSGIPEVDPDWKAKVPPDKQGRDPKEDEASVKLRKHRAADLGITVEQLAEQNKSRTRPALGARQPDMKLDLTKLAIPMLAINGEFDRPNAKTARMTREVKNFRSVVLPGKSHLTAIMGGYTPPEYRETLVAFINGNDAK